MALDRQTQEQYIRKQNPARLALRGVSVINLRWQANERQGLYQHYQ